MAQIITNHYSKFKPHSKAGQFLRYVKDAKGYLVWVPNPNNNGGTLKTWQDVIFYNAFQVPSHTDNTSDYSLLWEHFDIPNHLKMGTDSPTHVIKTNNPVLITLYARIPITLICAI